MKKLTLSILALLVIALSNASMSAKWVCCEDMGGSSISCEPFTTKEECNKYCGGDCQDVREYDKVDTSGGIAIDDLDIEAVNKKYVMNPSIKEAYSATK